MDYYWKIWNKMFSEKSWGSIFKWKIFLRWVVPIMMSNKHAICLIYIKKMISYAFFFIPCNGYVGLFFCTWQTSTLFIWGLFNLNSLLYITIVFRVFLLVLTRVAHPKLCFAQKPLLYPKRSQTIEENKQTHIGKKRGYKINHCVFSFYMCI